MSNSLKDALLGLGFKQAPPPPKPSRPTSDKPREGGKPPPGKARPAQGKPQGARPQGRPAPPRKAEFDLGKAYALRAQQEKDERIAAEAAKQEEARLRREARAKLVELLAGQALNDPTAEHARHFEYGGKIKRVHVTPDQLARLNKGELGVVQSEGRYVLVSADVLARAKAVFPPAVALEVDPGAPAPAEDYSDPRYQIPDDLTW